MTAAGLAHPVNPEAPCETLCEKKSQGLNPFVSGPYGRFYTTLRAFR